MKNNQNSLNGDRNKEDEGYKKKNINLKDQNNYLKDNNHNYVRDNNHNHVRDNHVKDNHIINNHFPIKSFHLQQDKKSNLKKFKYLHSVDEMQSAYLCALELTFKFLGVLSKSDQPTTFSKIKMSKVYYHMLRTAFDSIYQKRRRSMFFVGNEKGRRKSLNLDFTKKEKCDEYESNYGMLSVGMSNYDKGLSNYDFYDNGSNKGLYKDSGGSQLTLKKSKSNSKPNFDIISFIINFSSFKDSELPLSREGILGELRDKFGDIPRELDDDQIEFILFGGAHTFVNYKGSPLRDLLQLTYSSLRGLTKEYLKLKLIKTPERIEEINTLSIKNKNNDIKNINNNSFSSFNFLSYVNRYKDSVFDLYYFLNKPNLDKKEIEIFNKIIYWLTCLKKELPQEEVQRISNRVKIDLFFYSKQYTIIVEFIESII